MFRRSSSLGGTVCRLLFPHGRRWQVGLSRWVQTGDSWADI